MEPTRAQSLLAAPPTALRAETFGGGRTVRRKLWRAVVADAARAVATADGMLRASLACEARCAALGAVT